MDVSPTGDRVRLGVFMAILATLLVDIGLVFPVVVETALPAGSEALAAGSLVRCFKVLTYQNHWYWPDSIRLDTTPVLGTPLRDLWYQARIHRAPENDWGRSGWRPAGKDSIDLFLHESERLRLPIEGNPLIGRLFETYYDNFFEVVTTARTRTRLVTLSSIPCPHSVMK